ncbi:hypothetical protein HPB50_027954 [Hyalomma asiaticum]|nr:hypothetical protein HPB50_027954 [Hyalomma asiaticum]
MFFPLPANPDVQHVGTQALRKIMNPRRNVLPVVNIPPLTPRAHQGKKKPFNAESRSEWRGIYRKWGNSLLGDVVEPRGSKDYSRNTSPFPQSGPQRLQGSQQVPGP